MRLQVGQLFIAFEVLALRPREKIDGVDLRPFTCREVPLLIQHRDFLVNRTTLALVGAFVYSAHATVFKAHIIQLDSIDSTNLEAMRRAKAGEDEGLCIVAREQTRGRGRLDRHWHSPQDAGLYVSLLLRPEFELARWTLISLAAALAVSDALEKTCGLRVDIKWPNDIHFERHKLCGILIDTTETAMGLAAIVGIGINLTAQSFPPELESATSIESIIGETPSADYLLSRLVESFSDRYKELQTDEGCKQTIGDWCAKSSYAFEREVRVSTGVETFVGITRGLESDGALRVETADGTVKIVRAGDVMAVRAI